MRASYKLIILTMLISELVIPEKIPRTLISEKMAIRSSGRMSLIWMVNLIVSSGHMKKDL